DGRDANQSPTDDQYMLHRIWCSLCVLSVSASVFATPECGFYWLVVETQGCHYGGMPSGLEDGVIGPNEWQDFDCPTLTETGAEVDLELFYADLRALKYYDQLWDARDLDPLPRDPTKQFATNIRASAVTALRPLYGQLKAMGYGVGLYKDAVA